MSETRKLFESFKDNLKEDESLDYSYGIDEAICIVAEEFKDRIIKEFDREERDIPEKLAEDIMIRLDDFTDIPEEYLNDVVNLVLRNE